MSVDRYDHAPDPLEMPEGQEPIGIQHNADKDLSIVVGDLQKSEWIKWEGEPVEVPR